MKPSKLMMPCMMCHDKNNSHTESKLRRMEMMLREVEPVEDSSYLRRHSFNWSIHHRCKYGISCNDLRNADIRCNDIARRLEDKLVAVAMSDDNQLYFEMLQMLRGDFPNIYHSMEILRAQWKHDNEAKALSESEA